MLRSIALASVIALAIPAAQAADMYVPGPAGPGGYKDAPWYPTWAGFYLGGHAGAAFTDLRIRDLNEVPGTFKNDPTSFFGGGQLGYNFQRGNWVFGPEVDLGVMALDHTGFQPNTGNIIRSKLDDSFYADVTGRLGYAWGPALVYGKGGFAYFDGPVSNIDFGEFVRKATGFTGWTAGGGVEYMVSPAWSLKAEYLHFDFGTERTIGSDGDRYDNKLVIDTVKVGVNYHMGSGYVPLK
jgi:outer membrane immunogenic protein